MPTALIIGAGVAGPVAAMALQRVGVHCEVYEAHPRTAADVGAFLTLQTNGMDALRAIGAYDAVAGTGFPTPVMSFTSGTGRRLGSLPTGGVLADGTVGHTVRRADLYMALRDEALRRGIPVHHGHRLVDAADHDGVVRARFDDDTTATGDLLVGCDGIRSCVRSLIDPDAPLARRVPLLNLGGYADLRVPGAAVGEYHMVFGRRAFLGHVAAPDGTTWWFANPPASGDLVHESAASASDARWRALLRDVFADDRSPALDLLDATGHPLRGYGTWDIPTVPTWRSAAMVIVGDAAHATSPSSGQGASMAIEDGIQLGRCVRDLPTLASALAAYEGLRRARVERVVAAGARSSADKAVGPVGRLVRDLLMPVFLRRVAGHGRMSLDWMYDHHIDWDAPVAAEPVPTR